MSETEHVLVHWRGFDSDGRAVRSRKVKEQKVGEFVRELPDDADPYIGTSVGKHYTPLERRE